MPNTQMFLDAALQLGDYFLRKNGVPNLTGKCGTAEQVNQDEYIYTALTGEQVVMSAVSVMWYARNVIFIDTALKGCERKK